MHIKQLVSVDHLDEPIAILKRDSIKAYLIPEKFIAYFIDLAEDIKLAKVVNQRLKDLKEGKTKAIKVKNYLY